MEQAELVFDRSGDLAAPPGPSDVASAAIGLLRAAGHDEAILKHALSIGRSRVRRDPNNQSARRGIRLLETVIAFLGHRERVDEVGTPEEAVVGSPSDIAVIEFLGLAHTVEPCANIVSFRLGVLYPYSRDLRRVCTTFAAASRRCPEAVPMLLGDASHNVLPLSVEQLDAVTSYLASISRLYNRIAFAPGPAGSSVSIAHTMVREAMARATPFSGAQPGGAR